MPRWMGPVFLQGKVRGDFENGYQGLLPPLRRKQGRPGGTEEGRRVVGCERAPRLGLEEPLTNVQEPERSVEGPVKWRFGGSRTEL